MARKCKTKTRRDWLNESAYRKAKKAVESWPAWKREAYDRMVGRNASSNT